MGVVGLGHVRLVGRSVCIGLDPVDSATGHGPSAAAWVVACSVPVSVFFPGSTGVEVSAGLPGPRQLASPLARPASRPYFPLPKQSLSRQVTRRQFHPPDASQPLPPVACCADSLCSVRCRTSGSPSLLGTEAAGQCGAHCPPRLELPLSFVATRYGFEPFERRGPQRQFRGSTDIQHRQGLEGERMNRHQPSTLSAPPLRDRSTT